MDTMIGFFPISISQLDELKEHDVLLIGIPFEGKKQTERGSAKLPLKMRKYSKKFSGISAKLNINALSFNCYDLGNIININSRKSQEIIKKIWLLQKKKNFRIIVIGGDHLVTYYMLSEAIIDTSDKLITIDAHADLAREYPPGTKLSHATVFYNLINEGVITKDQLVIIGGHSFSQDITEFNEINNGTINFFSTESLTRHNFKSENLEKLAKLVDNANNTYVSLDLDILSRAFVPLVDTAEFFGFSPVDLLDVLEIVLQRALYIDIVEGRFSKKDVKEQDVVISLIFEILSQWERN